MASEKITNILEEIKTLTIIELADLVKAVEDEFGLSETDETALESIKTVGDVAEYVQSKQ